jgi:protein dithiol:quinone oxidoreductase
MRHAYSLRSRQVRARHARFWFVGAAVLCALALAAALVSQHFYDMQPCPWCVLQRVIVVVLILACAGGAIWPRGMGRAAWAAVVFVLALAGAAAALWQHFQAAASASCNLTWADKIVSQYLHLDSLLPDVFAARATCAEAAVKLAGVPYDFWSLALFALVALAAVQTLRPPK